MGGGDEVQQNPQALLEILGAGEIIGGDVEAGEGVDARAQGSKFRSDIPAAGHVEHFMLQEVGNTGGDGVFFTLQLEAGMDGAEIGDEVCKLLGKTGAGDHFHGQTVRKHRLVDGFAQAGIFDLIHGSPPSGCKWCEASASWRPQPPALR